MRSLTAETKTYKDSDEQLTFAEALGLSDTAIQDKDVLASIDSELVRSFPKRYVREGIEIYFSDALNFYQRWASPVVIISDGPYGISGYADDLVSHEGLDKWYEPHIKCWSERSSPITTLWFWNTEIGWATVHPVLSGYGWIYKGACIWDKGIGHIAGNSNTQNLRRLPVTTELCVHYVKEARFQINRTEVSMKQWLRHEWIRSGLPLSKTNEVCGVKNAATRKYFTTCHLWYYPPIDAFEKLVDYANKFGRPSGRPYFSINGKKPLSGNEWAKMRAKFHCEHGVTNVWRAPAVRGEERLKNGNKAIHTNQKPLSLIELTIRLSSDPGDVVWEPFGGLCTGCIASHRQHRRCYAAEIDRDYYALAISRLAHYDGE